MVIARDDSRTGLVEVILSRLQAFHRQTTRDASALPRLRESTREPIDVFVQIGGMFCQSGSSTNRTPSRRANFAAETKSASPATRMIVSA